MLISKIKSCINQQTSLVNSERFLRDHFEWHSTSGTLLRFILRLHLSWSQRRWYQNWPSLKQADGLIPHAGETCRTNMSINGKGRGGGGSQKRVGTLPGLNWCLKVSPCHMGFPVVPNETQRRLRCVRFNWGLIGTGNVLGHLRHQSVHLPPPPEDLRSPSPAPGLWMEHCVRLDAYKRLLKILKLISWNNLSCVCSLSLGAIASVKKHYGK